MRAGAAFVQQCHTLYGDCFTLNLLGQRMTFLFAAPAIQHYFTAPDTEITFGPAVQQGLVALDRRSGHGAGPQIFGLPPKHFFGKHYVMLSALREQLAPAGLAGYGVTLQALTEDELSLWPSSGKVELYGALQYLVFKVAVSTLFGRAFLQAQGHQGALSLQHSFFQFEAAFELAASPVPHLFLPRFRRARAHLLGALRASYKAGHFQGTVADALIQACGLPAECIPNMLLAMLWASQANSVPATFWSLAFLLLPENQHIQRRLVMQLAAEDSTATGAQPEQRTHALPNGQGTQQQQVQQSQQGSMHQAQPQQRHLRHTAGQQQAPAPSPVLAAALDRRSLLVLCVIEALRLRAMSIDVRIAASDVLLPAVTEGAKVLIQKALMVAMSPTDKGSLVALSPYTSHQDPRLFGPTASQFDPDRDGMLFGGSHNPHAAVVGVGGLAGLSFGGGKYRCPGRHFAEVEVGLLLGLLLTRFKFQLVGADPVIQASCSSGGSGNDGAKNGSEGPDSGSGQEGSVGSECWPGDPGGLLPPCDMTRLVGLKVPAGPCWVRFERRAHTTTAC
ncbi:hypothetical protein N2152v2_000875 [Parachlorella kessleri]